MFRRFRFRRRGGRVFAWRRPGGRRRRSGGGRNIFGFRPWGFR